METGGGEESAGEGEWESRVCQIKQGEENTLLLRVGPPARRFAHISLTLYFPASGGHRCRPFSPPVLAFSFYRADWSGSGRAWSPGADTFEGINPSLQPFDCLCVAPDVFLITRVTGVCPVTTDLIMRVNVEQQQQQQ